MYATFLERLGQAYKPEKIKGIGGLLYFRDVPTKLVPHPDGRFGAMMDVSLTNEVRNAPSPLTCCRILFSDCFLSGTCDVHDRFPEIRIRRFDASKTCQDSKGI